MSQNPFGHQRATCSSKLKQNAHQLSQSHTKLPDKIDTKKVVEMIKNADLYELINISLRSNELQNETVEEFISKALLKSGCSQTNKHNRVNDQQRQNLMSLFTPPNKTFQRQGSSTSPINQRSINDENQQTITDFIAQSVKQQKQQINTSKVLHNRTGNQVFRSQVPLQTSILENSPDQDKCISIFNNGQNVSNQNFQNYQSFNSKQQQVEEEEQNNHEMGFGKELDDTQDFENHEQRLDVPQPYSDQPRSPAEENTDQNTETICHLRNPSFSGDINFIKSSAQQQHLQDSLYFHGDQFSFQQKQNSSMIKKSPDTSNYSTINQEKNRSPSLEGSKNKKHNNLLKSNERKQINSQNCHKKETHLKIEEPKIQSRNLNNFRLGLQTQLNRSSSSNSFLTSKDQLNASGTQSSRNYKGSVKHVFQPKTFIQTSRTPFQEPSICKTPDTSQSYMDQCTFLNSNIKQEDFDQSIRTSEAKDNRKQNQILNGVAKKNIEVKKQRLLNSFSQMNIKFLIELERIKKPSQVAYITARLVCQFFGIFRELSSQNLRGIHMEDLIEWCDIQRHINGYVIKYTNELLTQIKSKMMNPDQMNQQTKDTLEIRLFDLKQDFFQGDNLKLFKHLSTNKNLQTIVTFIFNVISYYLDLQYNDKLTTSTIISQADIQSIQESYRLSTSSRQLEDSRSFTLERGIYDAMINQSSTQKNNQRSNEKSQNRRQSRNFTLGKTETTPTLQRDKTPRILVEEKQPIMQKSGSRCLLQRRDRSQLIQKDTYSSNKSPLIKAKQDSHQMKFKRQDQQQEQTLQSSRKHNFDQTLQRNTQQRQKSLSKSPSQVLTKAESKSQLKNLEIKQESIMQSDISGASYYFPIDFQSKDSQIEEPLQLNYRMMVESTNLQQIIKEKTAAIEENMKILQENQNESEYFQENSQKKYIDMNLIEQIKQRRKDQKIKEALEERLEQSANRRKSMETNL